MKFVSVIVQKIHRLNFWQGLVNIICSPFKSNKKTITLSDFCLNHILHTVWLDNYMYTIFKVTVHSGYRASEDDKWGNTNWPLPRIQKYKTVSFPSQQNGGRNLKSEKYKDYSQKQQRSCNFMNSISFLYPTPQRDGTFLYSGV